MRVNTGGHELPRTSHFICLLLFFEWKGGVLKDGCDRFSRELVLSLRPLHSGRIFRNILN